MRQKEEEVEVGVTEQEEEIAVEIEAEENCGKTAKLTDTISTRQTVTKTHFTSEIPQLLCLFCLHMYRQNSTMEK